MESVLWPYYDHVFYDLIRYRLSNEPMLSLEVFLSILSSPRWNKKAKMGWRWVFPSSTCKDRASSDRLFPFPHVN